MVDDYDSGLDLSEKLDLNVDATGDIQSSDGLDELQKDLSFRLILAFEDTPFGVLDPETREDVRVTARNAIKADPRVTELEDITIRDTDDLDQIAIGITAIAGGDSITFVQVL